MGWRKKVGKHFAMPVITAKNVNCVKQEQLCETRTNVAIGIGNPHGEILFIGEGFGITGGFSGD